MVFAAALSSFILGGNENDVLLDRSASSDYVYSGAGNDLAIYIPSENKKKIDFYDGGAGFDILQLKLTQKEYEEISFQNDHVRSQFFFLNTMNPHSKSDEGPVFSFISFHLNVRNFEILDIEIIPDKENKSGKSVAKKSIPKPETIKQLSDDLI